jgi:hypothetical protein
MIKAIVENERLVNLEDIMKDVEWTDYPTDVPLFCFSYRTGGICEFEGKECHVGEFHKCGGGRPAHILMKNIADKSVILNYEENTEWHRDSHHGKTYIRSSTVGKLDEEWQLYEKSIQ